MNSVLRKEFTPEFKAGFLETFPYIDRRFNHTYALFIELLSLPEAETKP